MKYMIQRSFSYFVFAGILLIIFTFTIFPILQQKIKYTESYILWQLGFWFGKAKKLQESKRLLRKSLEINPYNPRAYYHLGTILAMTGDYTQAVINLRKAIQMDKTFAPAYNNLGFCYLKLKNPKQAIKYFKQALCLDKTLKESYYGLSRAYLELKQYDLALETANLGLRIFPKYITLIVFKARILEEGYNNLQEAEKLCLEALKISPSSQYAKRVLQWIRYRKQQIKKIGNWFNKTKAGEWFIDQLAKVPPP